MTIPAKTDFATGGAHDRTVFNKFAGDGLTTTGNVFYVHHSGSATGPGYAPGSAYNSIDAAVGACTANNGDKIIVLEGHAETVSTAAGIDADVAGITIVGRGDGNLKPTVTIGTLTTATVRINAANVTIRGIKFTAGTAQLLVKMIDVNENYATIENCDFVGASTATFLVKSFVNIATTFDNTTIRGCTFYQGTDPASTNAGADTGAIFIVDSENIVVEKCHFYGFFETALIHNKTSPTINLRVIDCTGYVALSDAQPFLFVSTATGFIVGGGFITPAETAVTEATLSGTIPAKVFTFGTRFGNDGGGGQNAVLLTDAS